VVVVICSLVGAGAGLGEMRDELFRVGYVRMRGGNSIE